MLISQECMTTEMLILLEKKHYLSYNSNLMLMRKLRDVNFTLKEYSSHIERRAQKCFCHVLRNS